MTPRALSFLVQSIALLILLAFFPDAKAQTTPKCFINGGTERAGCFPAKMIFTTYPAIVPSYPSFDSFESAKAHVFRTTMNNAHCTSYMGVGTCRGILTGTITWNGTSPSGDHCNFNGSISPGSGQGWSRSFSFGVHSVSYHFALFGKGYHQKNCGDGMKDHVFYYRIAPNSPVSGYPQCPANHAILSEDPNQYSGNFGYFCAPTATASNPRSSPSRGTCQDGPGDGCATAGNPVLLSDGRAKVETVTDLTVAGDYPIEWKRHYSTSDGVRQHAKTWTFFLNRKADVAYNSVTGKSTALLDRGDGGTLIFDGTGTPGSRTWTFVQPGASVLKPTTSVLADWTSSGDPKAVVLTRGDGTQEFYDGQGKLVKTTNAQGRNHVYTYGSLGLPIKIEQDNGRYLQIAYQERDGYAASTVSIPSFTNPTDDDPSGYEEVTVRSYPQTSQAIDWFLQPVVASVTDGQRTVTYEWQQTYSEQFPKLTRVSGPGNSYRTLHYGENGTASNQWNGWSDADGRRMGSYVMTNSSMNAVSQQWKGSTLNETDNAKKIDYLSFTGNGVLDGNGNSFPYSSASYGMTSFSKPCPWCGGASAKTFTYRTDGRYDHTIGFNNQRTNYTYDAQGNVASTKEAATSTIPRTTSFTWATPYRYPLTQTEQVKDRGTASTRVTAWTYNAKWQPLTQTITASDNGVSSSRQFQFGYDSNDRLSTITDPKGVVTTLLYNAYGDLVAKETGTGTSGAELTRWGGYLPDGLPRWSIDAWGVVTRYEWDLEGRLLESAQWAATGLPSDPGLGATSWSPPAAPSHARTAAYTYSAAGRVQRIDDTDGTYVTFDYDFAGRLIQFQTFDVNEQMVSRTVLTLDRMSNVTAMELRNGANQVVTREKRVLDEQRRVRQLLNAADQALYTQNYNTEHQPTTQTDILSRSSSNEYDALGRLTKFLDAQNQPHLMTYGPQDEVLTATDPRGVITTYAYNGFGDLVSLQSPDRGSWSFTYDAAGRLTTTTDPRGVVTTSTYDALARPIGRSFSDAGVTGAPAGFEAGTVTQTFTYDTCPNGLGRLCGFSDATGSTAYSYNAWGQPIGKAWTAKAGTPAAGVTLATGYAYDAATGRLTTVTLPSGKVLNLAYGSDGRVSGLGYDGQPVVANVQWTAFDAIAGWSWPQAVGWSGIHSSVAFTYDLDGRPTAIEDLDERSLVWDNGNRLVGVDDPGDASKSQVYGYDSLDRLTSADIGSWGGAHTFGYDPVGNRTSLTDTVTNDGWQYSYGLSNNRLSQRWAVTGGTPGTPLPMSYDAMGNLVNDGLGLSLSYDSTGRLTTATKSAAQFTAGYNALGQRVTKTSTGTSTPGTRLYALDETGRPLGVYVVDSGASNGYRVEEEYVHLDGWRPVAVVRPDAATGMANPQVFPILTDHLGTPRKVLDGDTGETRWAWDAKQPFGHELPNETPTPGLPAFAFDLRFPGQRYDDETGLFHNGFRDYHPGLGRYVQSDPLGLEAGWNTFAYVGAGPLEAIDPDGLLKRDSHGNLIFKQNRTGSFYHEGGNYWSWGRYGHLYADDGTPIEAYLNFPRTFRANANYDCHGLSFSDGDYWINNDQVRKLLAGDSYRKIGGGPYNGTTYNYKGNKITPGDIVIYTLKGKPIHSGIYIGDGMIKQKGGVSGSTPSQRTISNGWNWNGKSGPDYQLEVWRKP